MVDAGNLHSSDRRPRRQDILDVSQRSTEIRSGSGGLISMLFQIWLRRERSFGGLMRKGSKGDLLNRAKSLCLRRLTCALR